MKFLAKFAGVPTIAIASCLLLNSPRAEAGTFQFSQVMGTGLDAPDYNPLRHGTMGLNRLTVTFTGEDRNGDGLLQYFRFGDVSEITDIKATWGGLKFNLDNLWLFTAGRLPGTPEKIYDEDILLHQFRFVKGNYHLDYRPINLYDWYKQFRVYRCPAALNCLNYESIDYPIADGLISGEYLLGFQNYFAPGSPAYLVKDTENPPVKSTPEPGAIAGLVLLAPIASKLRKRRTTE